MSSDVSAGDTILASQQTDLRDDLIDQIAALGDLLYGTAADTAAVLSVGADNNYLKVATDTPAWEALDITDDTAPVVAADLDLSTFDLVGNGGSEGIKISSAGEVNMTSQPCVLAYNSVTDTNVTGNGAIHTFEYDTEITDQNSDFTGDTFTAPIAGNYLILPSFNAMGGTNAMAAILLRVVASNRDADCMIGGGSEASDRIGGGRGVIMDMDASDTVTITLEIQGESSDIIDVEGGTDLRSRVSITLLS